MSVINQMLKDLDKRQHEQVNPLTANNAIADAKPQSQRWIIIILMLLLVISLAVIVWQKWNEKPNDTLSKNLTIGNNTTLVKEASSGQERAASQLSAHELSEKPSKDEGTETAVTAAKHSQSKTKEVEKLATNKVVTENVAFEKEPEQVKVAPQNLIQQEKPETKQSLEKITQVDVISPAIVEQTETQLTHPTLTISRKQLTPDQLAIKKIAQAEQAIADQEIKKAEQLLEEVLLVVPSHKSARKQLAALWFGKQSYQAALNLLSQGLALDNQDAEFRLMKARIYLSQGQTKSAFDELVVLDNIRLLEYQSVLASSAQQLSLFTASEKAYNILTELAPSVGRWWLGLAIAQDSQGQFQQAKMSYQNALKQQDLSSETAQFAKNRLVELGE